MKKNTHHEKNRCIITENNKSHSNAEFMKVN